MAGQGWHSLIHALMHVSHDMPWYMSCLDTCHLCLIRLTCMYVSTHARTHTCTHTHTLVRSHPNPRVCARWSTCLWEGVCSFCGWGEVVSHPTQPSPSKMSFSHICRLTVIAHVCARARTHAHTHTHYFSLSRHANGRAGNAFPGVLCLVL